MLREVRVRGETKGIKRPSGCKSLKEQQKSATNIAKELKEYRRELKSLMEKCL